MAEAVVLVSEVKTASGEKDGRQWTRWDLLDGNATLYSTFATGLGNTLQGFVGKRVKLTFSENDRGKRLEAIEEAKEAASSGDYMRRHHPDVARSILLQSCLKVAAETVNAAADKSEAHVDTWTRVGAIHSVALDLAIWVEETSAEPFPDGRSSSAPVNGDDIEFPAQEEVRVP